jgi:predicted tellurium resistance membrane protein TerC
MKAIIKYILNVFGLMFIVIGLTCNLLSTWGSIFYTIGAFMYMVERQTSLEDEEKQEKQIKKLEEKVEELENRSRKKYVKPKLSVETIPTTYEEYLKNKDRW